MKKIAAGGLALGLVLAAPPVAGAQTFGVEGSAGVAVPTGELADMAEASAGFEAAATYYPVDRVGIRAVGSLDLLSGVAVDALGYPARTPDIELWSGGGGVEVRVTPAGFPLRVLVSGTGSATSFNTAVFDEIVTDPETDEPVGDFAATYFTATAGLKAGYEVRPGLLLFVEGAWRRMLADEEETDVFELLSPEVEAFDAATWIPVRLGLRYTF